MARKKTTKKANGIKLTAIYTGDTKNYNKFSITTDGHVGSIYFPIEDDIEDKNCTVELVFPSNDDWEDAMETLIENTRSPKALSNLKQCLAKHS